MASELNSCYNPDRKVKFQQSLIMFRRSMSLNDYERDYDILKVKNTHLNFSPISYAKPKIERHLSMHVPTQSLAFESLPVQQQWPTSGSNNGLPSETEMNNLAAVLFENYFDCYVRYIILPIVFIFTMVYTFFNMPVQPKAEIYRSLSATFVLLIGVIVQCSIVTIWATRRYGLNDLIAFLRYYISSQNTAT